MEKQIPFFLRYSVNTIMHLLKIQGPENRLKGSIVYGLGWSAMTNQRSLLWLQRIAVCGNKHPVDPVQQTSHDLTRRIVARVTIQNLMYLTYLR